MDANQNINDFFFTPSLFLFNKDPALTGVCAPPQRRIQYSVCVCVCAETLVKHI